MLGEKMKMKIKKEFDKKYISLSKKINKGNVKKSIVIDNDLKVGFNEKNKIQKIDVLIETEANK